MVNNPTNMIVNSRLIDFNDVLDTIFTTEREFEEQIDSAVKDIIMKNIKIVFIAGPSASGKTTFSKILSNKLNNMNYNTIRIEMDNYFKTFDSKIYPKTKNGKYDFENPDCLNKDLFIKQMKQLKDGKSVKTPYYNFEKKISEEGKTYKIDNNTIIIVEGIHALNPIFNIENSYKIYVSTNSRLSIINPEEYENKIIINKRKIRLIRRCIRDYFTRATSIEETIDMWENIVDGEISYIAAYKEKADKLIDTTLIYEPFILCSRFNFLVKEAQRRNKEFKHPIPEIIDLPIIDSCFLPKNSLLNEFLH